MNITASARELPRLKTDLKLAARIHVHYRDQGEAAGLAYAVQLVRQMPHMADKLYALMPAARAQRIQVEVDRQRGEKAARQAEEHARLEAAQVLAAQAEEARRRDLDSQLDAARRAGEAVVYLAGLAPADRDRIADAQERKKVIALRKGAMLKGKVLAALACTPAELERWHADGRLPHLYVRKLSLGAWGKAQPCRLWATDVVEAARAQVEGWRVSDKARTRRPAKPVSMTQG